MSSAEASRCLPASLSPALERPVSIPPAPSADASFELLTDGDRILFTALSSLQESELAQVLDRRRFRPLSATVSQKLASGVSTRPAPSISLGSSDLRWKLHQGDYFLEMDPLGPVDSPNLYQAFGFDGMNVVDPWGMCSGPGDEDCREGQQSIFFRAYQWVSSAIGYTNQFVPGLITEAENIGTGVGEFGVATVMDPTVPGRVLDEMVRDTVVTSVRVMATDPDVLLANAANESIDLLSDPEKASAATLHVSLLAAGGLGGRAAASTKTVRRFANAADDLGDLARLPRVQAAVTGRGAGVSAPRINLRRPPGLGSGNAYSVAYQTRIPSSAYPGRSRRFHFQKANENLLKAIDTDPAFARAMEDLIPNLRQQLVGPRAVSRRAPRPWAWHHAPESGVMQLVPKIQHTAPGPLQKLLHPIPRGRGGWWLWGTP